MKKRIIWLLCIAMIWQSSINVYAEDVNMAIKQLQNESMAEGEPVTEADEVQKVDPAEEDKEEPEGEQSEEDREEPGEEQTGEDKEEPGKEQAGEDRDELEEEQTGEDNETLEEELTEDDEEQATEDDKIESVEEAVETEEEEASEDEDPQYGRANGYIDEDFFGIQLFSANGYIHDERFADYIVNDMIDVSKFQGTIDWKQVKASGIDYAMIRVGYRGYGQSGSLNTDDKFKENIQNAIASGVKVGVYFFSQAITEAEAKEEAEYVLARIKDYNISLPVTIDFEYASSSSGLTGRLYNAKLSKSAATKICQRFCATVENSGYSAMVYANKSMLENGLNASEIAEDYQIWLANYATSTSYKGDYNFWQYTQSGKVNGISGNVDKSFWYEESKVVYAEIPEGIYTISTCLDSNKVIDISKASMANGVQIQIYTSNNNWNQKFYIRSESENTYTIMSANSGKFLEVRGSKIYQSNYTGAENQQWRFRINKNGSYVIESAFSRKVMDVSKGSTNNGNPVILYEYHEVNWQNFRLNIESEQTVRSLKNGVYVIETLLVKDKVLNFKTDSEQLEICKLESSDTQKFNILYTGNGCYQIASTYNQKVLISGNDGKVFWGKSGDNSLEQKWILKKYSADAYLIISAYDGKCLEVTDEEIENGTVVLKSEGNGSQGQQFKFYETVVGAEVLEDGIYTIHSALDDTKVLDVCGASKKSDANIHLYQSNGKAWQQFVIKRMDDGNYMVHSYYSGMSMDVVGSNVLQYFPVEKESQRWKIIPVGNGYYNIICASENKALDASGGKAKNGTNIIIYKLHGGNNQKFRFEKTGTISDTDISQNELENGTYMICSSLDENKVLDVNKASLYTGVNIFLYSSSNGANQQFVFQKNSETGLYTITSKKSGMRVTYQNGLLKNGTNVYQDAIKEDIGNQWKLKHVIGDYYMIYAGDSGFCMDVTGAKTANGTNIEIYQSNNGKAQIFKLKKVSNQITTEQDASKELKEGLYTISSGLDDNMVLDVLSASKEEGANIALYKKHDGINQKFLVKKLENGNYTIKALFSDKLLTVDGYNICQKTDQGALNQQWEAIYAGNDYYTLKASGSEKVMDLTGGKSNNGTNVAVYNSKYSAWQRFKFTQTTAAAEAKFEAAQDNGFTVAYEVYVKGNEASADNNYYLMQADCYSGKIFGSPLTSVEKNFEVSINLKVSDRTELKELAMDKLVLAVKNSDGTYKAVTDAVSISNPEAIAKNTAEIFKASSKKGLQGVAYASDGSQPVDARYTNSKQTMLNLDLADVVNPKSDYTTFTYKGKTYQFSNCSALVANIKSLNAGYEQYLYGNNGTTKVSVSLCLLLSYDSANSFLIDSAARQSGHSYYMLNVREEKARETLEALFVYLGELFGQEDCYVTNWILGNEINSSKAWNYSGSLDFDTYMQCYTTAFGMLYNAVKSEKTGNTVCISLDNGWTAVPDTYAGKTTLDTFAKKINAENPNVDWGISYHAYSYPLTRADFWNDSQNTSNSTSTRYISMQNITVLTNYAASLEKTYKMASGSIRVLLTEQGYSYSAGADTQAAAIARGYYLAEFNDRIDTFIIRAIVDDAEEAKGQLYFGIMNSQQDKRTSFYVYEYMDSDLSELSKTSAQGTVSSGNYSKFNSAKNILCNTNWKSIVPGFNATKLAGIK